MFTLTRLIYGSLVVFVLTSVALAQENRAPLNTTRESVATAPLVTVTATSKRVRFVSPGSVVQLRLEVYNEAGQKLFDTQLHGGNVLDWHFQNGAGERVAPGSYASVLTIKSLSGRLSQRVGLVTVNDEKAAVETTGGAQFTVAQQQTIGPVESNAAFTVIQESESEAITTVTHDGKEGQVTRTRGALSFRVGDVFSGNDKEQVRLTAEGNLGIGTTKPQTKLDVVGMIRAREGFQFSDGSTLKINDTGALTHTSATGTEFVNATGTGTTNQLTKWTDGPGGVLGDSLFAESGGNVAIGGPVLAGANFDFRQTNASGDVLQRIWNQFGDLTPRPAAGAKLRYVAAVGATSQLQLTDNAEWLMAIAGNNQSGMQFRVRDNAELNSEAGLAAATKMTIARNGNVGIGTTNPQAKLDVNGALNVNGNAVISGNIAAKYQDVAEWVEAREPLAPGTVVSLDSKRTNAVIPSRHAYDAMIAGVVSAQPGVILGEASASKVMVTMSGRVVVNVDASKYPIRIGDLLVTGNSTRRCHEIQADKSSRQPDS